ncbi:hypothetical protein HK405_014953, partial [Cladochytrium tenue]
QLHIHTVDLSPAAACAGQLRGPAVLLLQAASHLKTLRRALADLGSEEDAVAAARWKHAERFRDIAKDHGGAIDRPALHAVHDLARRCHTAALSLLADIETCLSTLQATYDPDIRLLDWLETRILELAGHSIPADRRFQPVDHVELAVSIENFGSVAAGQQD